MDPNDASVTNFITRAEYESRHAELQTRILSLEAKIESLGNKIDAFNMSVNLKIADQVSNSNAIILKKWQFFGSQIVSILSGVVMYTVIQYIAIHFIH